jgi:heme/copper-type cytochrome/quinol oxidase subunit 2
MKNKLILGIFWGIIIFLPITVLGATISFDPLGVGENSYENFFKTILQGILNLIALLAIVFIVIAGVVYLIASSSGNDKMVETAKKIWAGSLIGLALSVAAPTFINQILAIIGGEVSTDLSAAPSLSSILDNTLTFLLSIIGILAIIGLTINSILMLTAGGDSSKFEKAKKGFNFSLLGLIVAGSALILVRLIVDLIQG